MCGFEEYIKAHPELWELENLEYYLSTLDENECDGDAEKRYYELCRKRDNGTIC